MNKVDISLLVWVVQLKMKMEVMKMTILRYSLPEYDMLIVKEHLWYIIAYSVYNNLVTCIKLITPVFAARETVYLSSPKPLHTNSVEPMLDLCSSDHQNEALIHPVSIYLAYFQQNKVFSGFLK